MNLNQHGVDIDALAVGDRIKFRAVRMWSVAPATRVITEIRVTPRFCERSSVGVSFEGCRPFVVHLHEILEHYPRGET